MSETEAYVSGYRRVEGEWRAALTRAEKAEAERDRERTLRANVTKIAEKRSDRIFELEAERDADRAGLAFLTTARDNAQAAYEQEHARAEALATALREIVGFPWNSSEKEVARSALAAYQPASASAAGARCGGAKAEDAAGKDAASAFGDHATEIRDALAPYARPARVYHHEPNICPICGAPDAHVHGPSTAPPADQEPAPR